MATPLPTDRHITYQWQYRTCGKRERCRTCREGRGHGPYAYAYWREGGKLHSGYVGKYQSTAARAVRRAKVAAARRGA